MDVADLIIESRTQDAETIQKVLEQSGHTNFKVETHSDSPEAETPPAEPAPAAAAAPAAPAAEPATSTQPPAPGEAKPVRGYKLKLEVAREENARLKGEIQKLTSRSTPPVEAAAPPPTTVSDPPPASVAKPKPVPESFEYGVYDPAYIEAVTDWRYDERRRLEKEEETTRATQAADEAKRNANTRDETAFKDWWNGQIEEAKERHEDFDAVMTKDHGRPIVNPVMYEAIQSADQGAELAYWLGTHPEESERISNITALKPGETAVDFRKKLRLAMIELSKIELPDFPAEDDGEPPQPAAPVAAAPPAPVAPKAAAAAAAPSAAPRTAAPAAPASKPAPPNPVGSRGASSRKRLSQMSTEELRALSTDQYRKLRVEEYGQ